ncbi:hypothetical protein FZ934_20165 (plasmid) [Rhizobium grahamii]|uniref:TnsA endonuclease N-terminal domain-containing protein n=1 Tax=Rhizobium grahamii TaxID=1120045 RepID=A0A5Q0CFH5_9HYPH|nr:MULTISPECIES: hypothetical protein [Rhizobium]QFY62697.1 hypothetical protein FZ934_20165 [Rhizobium grahamii]QRM52559.1 hypothetical protein F3Y33_25495 [Rhizobium sp. BG6]
MSVTFARSVSRRLSRKRVGLDFLDRRNRDDRIFGLQDKSLRRTLTVPERRVPNPKTLYRLTHGPAARVPPMKKMKTARGYTIFNNYVVYHESELEHRVSLRLQTRSDVAQLYSQSPVFHYHDDEKKLHRHVADFLAIYKNGFRRAFVVKMERKREEMEELIERIKAHPSSRAVDDIQLLTERYGTIEAAENAEMIRWSRERHDQDDVDELLALLVGKEGWFRLGTLLRDCPSLLRRRVAIWRLIDLGHLFSVTGEKVTELTWLGFAPSGASTGLCG